MLNQKELNEKFTYKEGMLFYNNNLLRPHLNSCRAGTNKYKNTYRQITFNRKIYREHRVIWVMFNGDIPQGMLVDHKDRNPANNRIDNLRLATPLQSCHNIKCRKGSRTGIKCVTWHKSSQSWQVKVTANKKTKTRFFHSINEAKEAHKKMATEMHGEFAAW